jgi:predicted ATPase/DNA-binding CsgD family transcriptional regulator
MAEARISDAGENTSVVWPPAPLRLRQRLNIAAPQSPLIGRDRELAATLALLRQPGRRLLTLTGPGGVGKTRLALAVAQAIEGEFADGAAFVPLASVGDATLVLSTIARVLEVRETPERPLAASLAAALHPRHLLLVLDNFEHVAAAATDIARLLEACPKLTILVTSRAPLQLSDEQRLPTPPLTFPVAGDASAPNRLLDYGAVEFFVDRARRTQPDFALDAGNAATIAAICRHLDGLPLAIELAAAWVRVLSPETLLARLQPRLALLTGGGIDRPIRLQTMRGAIAWSYDLLSEDEARLFRRLAVFVGGFSLEAALFPCPPAPSVLDLLAGLIDKSLLHQTHSDGSEPRFAMLETVREFALEQLEASGEVMAAGAAHAAWVTALAQAADPEMPGPRERHWVSRLDMDLGNIRAALTWSLEHDVAAVLCIAAPLWGYWSVYYLGEGRRWLNAALATLSPAAETVKFKALTTDAALACLMGDFASGLASSLAAADEAALAGDAMAEARARWIVGCNQAASGQPAEAVVELDRALTLFTQATTPADRTRLGYTRATRGAVALMLGEVDRGVALYEQALAEVRAGGSELILIIVLCDFAGWLVSLGETPPSGRGGHGGEQGDPSSGGGLGGGTARARRLLEEALSRAAGQPEYLMAQSVHVGLAVVDAVTGHAEAAARRLGAIEAMCGRVGFVLPAHYQERIAHATALARRALGDDAYATARAAGHAHPEDSLAAVDAAAAQREVSEAITPATLSPREIDVLRLLVSGWSDKEIAAALAIGRRTVSSHVAAIRAKLDAPSRTAAATIAVRDHLL